MFQVI
jgi:serine/threonine protein kinase